MGHPRPLRSFVLTVSAAVVMAGTLTGCAPDARVSVIEESIAASASKATPYLIGVLSPDVSKALSEAGDQSRVMVPVLAPDLTTATAEVSAESSATDLYRTAQDAAAALADSGRDAWQTWLEGNRDAVEYVETSIPVTVSGKDSQPASVQVDEAALKLFAGPIEAANLELFVRASEALPQWQRTMVVVHAWDFLPQVTALPDSLAALATLDSVEPLGDGRFAVSVRHLDPKAAILYQVEQAKESYGTGKIWGKVTKADFEARMETVAEVPASAVPELSTEATVKISTTGDGTYLPAQSLADNLAAQSDRYRAEAEAGSFTAPTDLDQVRDDAIAKALEELSKRVIKEQKRPGTQLLTGGKSGQQVTIKTGGSVDKHVTFFKWGSSKVVVSAFVKAGKTIKVRVPVGSYRLVYASGKNWYGKKHSFGPTGDYREFKTNPASTKPLKIKVQANYTYTVTIESGSATDPGSVSSGSTDNPFEE